MKHRDENAKAFTLIELLVVVAILAILVTLVVGVGSHVRTTGLQKDTAAMLQIVQTAVDAYRETLGTYPVIVPFRSPPDNNHTVDHTFPPPSPDPNIWKARANLNSADLYSLLQKTPKSKEVLQALPSERRNNGLIDAFGEAIGYNQKAGAGGTPVIFSAGKDRKWNNSDDLRSDNR